MLPLVKASLMLSLTRSLRVAKRLSIPSLQQLPVPEPVQHGSGSPAPLHSLFAGEQVRRLPSTLRPLPGLPSVPIWREVILETYGDTSSQPAMQISSSLVVDTGREAWNSSP